MALLAIDGVIVVVNRRIARRHGEGQRRRQIVAVRTESCVLVDRDLVGRLQFETVDQDRVVRALVDDKVVRVGRCLGGRRRIVVLRVSGVVVEVCRRDFADP